MVSRRKLEEEIARTTDPQLRKQLQELLDKRERRRKETVGQVKDTAKAIGEQCQSELDNAAPAFGVMAVIMWAGILVFLAWWIISETSCSAS